MMFCHPVRPDLEGKNVRHLKDINGKPFIQSFLRAVSGKERAGWAHYRWPRPGQSEPAWKSAYLVRVTAPSGKEYVVGSGVHTTRTERMFVVSTVEHAARLLRKEGAAAFPALRDPSRDFLYGDVYVFVIDWRGKELVNPASPELEGQNVMDLKDKTGRPIVREMFRLLRSRPSGWLDYQWPKPGATVPSRKSSYIRRVKMGGDTVLVGAGVYLD